jgi:signal transduction histidine kinase
MTPLGLIAESGTRAGVDLAPAWSVIGRLWARLSHDLNNHLASVLGNAELGGLSKDPERMHRCLVSAGRSAEDLKSIFGALGSLASAVGPFDPQRDTLGEVVRPVEVLLGRSFEKAGIRFTRDVAAVPGVTLDRPKVSLALAGFAAAALEGLRKAPEGVARDIGVTGFVQSNRLRIRLACSLPAPAGADQPEAAWGEVVAAMHRGRLDLSAGPSGTDIELDLAL